jgi:hypothetical protein
VRGVNFGLWTVREIIFGVKIVNGRSCDGNVDCAFDRISGLDG